MAEWVSFSEIIRNAALTIAAIVGAILAWRQLSPASLQARSAITQADLARRAHVTELFNCAAGQLRDPNLEIRLAAIYVLREVAKDFPDLSNPFSSSFKPICEQPTPTTATMNLRSTLKRS